jgi:Leucine-rich repeat (LRR) protein
VKELGLNRNLVSVDILSAFNRFNSLQQLDLECFLDNELDSGSELGPIFSWIGQHTNLTSLGLFGCNFSRVSPTLLSNFKNVKSLKINYCDLPKPVLHAVGDLTGLQTLEISPTTYVSMPYSIGNLTNLRNLYVYGLSGLPASMGGLTNLRNLYISRFSGPMPASMGELTNLRNMYIEDSGFSGSMPAAIGKLTNLINLSIEGPGFSGPMPAAIGNLTNLEAMEIRGCRNSGLIPYAIGQLNKLRYLVLQCNFSGSIPSSIVNLTHLTMLGLSFNFIVLFQKD